MSRKFVTIFLAVVLAMVSTSYGMTPTPTNQYAAWTGTPTITCLPLPSNGTVGESFANNIMAGTFTVLTGMNTKLDMISVGVAGAQPGGNWGLRLADLGVVAAPQSNLATFPAGTDLWGGTVTWNYGGSAQMVYNLDFTGAEELILATGHTYAFEMTGGTTGQMYFYRGGNVYAGGSIYDGNPDGSLGYVGVNAPRAADMAVYLIPEPATIAMLGLGGLALIRRKR